MQRTLFAIWRRLLEEEEPFYTSRQERVSEEKSEDIGQLDIDPLGDRGFKLG